MRRRVRQETVICDCGAESACDVIKVTYFHKDPQKRGLMTSEQEYLDLQRIGWGSGTKMPAKSLDVATPLGKMFSAVDAQRDTDQDIANKTDVPQQSTLCPVCMAANAEGETAAAAVRGTLQ